MSGQNLATPSYFHFHSKGMQTPKKYFLDTFYDWSNVLDASQATLAMAGARKDGKNARTEACLACAGPCVATGLIWPLGLAWVGSLWPDVPAWVSVAWVCESCFMLLAGPLTCLTITLDRHHNPMFAMLTKRCKEIMGMGIFSKDRQQNWKCYTTNNIPGSEGGHFLISTSFTRITCQNLVLKVLQNRSCVVSSCFVLLWLMDQSIVVESRTFSNKSFPAPLALQCWLEQNEKSMDRSIEIVD